MQEQKSNNNRILLGDEAYSVLGFVLSFGLLQPLFMIPADRAEYYVVWM
jgi:hypothetical protein